MSDAAPWSTRVERSARRVLLVATAILVAVITLAAPRRARALPEPAAAPSASPAAARAHARPYDAPLLEPKGATVPPLPPEYLTQEEGWLRLAYHPSARERVRPLVEQANAIRNELAAQLSAPPLASIEVRIAVLPGEMPRLSPSEPPGYANAVAWSELGLIVMSLASPLSLEPPRPADVLRHELAHIALDQAAGSKPIPRWFHEGYSVHVAGDHTSLRAQTLCFASLRGRLLGLSELEAHLPADAPEASVAYAEAADFIRYLTRDGAQDRFASLVQRVRDGAPFERALAGAYEEAPSAIELAWRKDMAKRYGFLPVLLSGTLVWVAVAAAVAIRRARQSRARRPVLVRHSKRVEVEARARPAVMELSASVSRSIAAQRARAARAESAAARGEPLPPDADVPKVEHEGEWHTLH